ncbi:hypothetical protein GGI25_002391 [Coemansia spiralis]|uniref:Uncharacterized protein n=2 Tax=Coemansia TaxID=4863 RepID=A0A9W8G8S7_9FUNG|nr:hypothetical protein GGI25_002391 [Coemansia spiralis]
MDDIKRTFEQAGDVWDVIPLESKMTGLPLKQAIVRFYNGSYQPADSSDAPPVLPPPTEEEIRIVKNAVQDAINRFHRSMLNGVQIYAHHHFDDNPYQLHGWYEEKRRMQMLYSSIKSQQIERFPVSPFRQPLQKGDDYQKGFMEGFKLGMIDGSKEVS